MFLTFAIGTIISVLEERPSSVGEQASLGKWDVASKIRHQRIKITAEIRITKGVYNYRKISGQLNDLQDN